MLKCPFCRHDNEDGAPFCEQCNSDLRVMSAGMSVQPAEAVPWARAVEENPAAGATVRGLPGAGTRGAEANSPHARGSGALFEETGVPPATLPAAPRTPTASLPRVEINAAADPTGAGGVDPDRLPPAAQPKLLVLRGLKIGVEYPLYEGHNFIGRTDEKPVDIDLEDQEAPERIWSSRQHAVISLEDGKLIIEDLNSTNGTFVNRTRIHPGQKRPLRINDVLQIGTVQLKIKA
jgi:hypothetical protein